MGRSVNQLLRSAQAMRHAASLCKPGQEDFKADFIEKAEKYQREADELAATQSRQSNNSRPDPAPCIATYAHAKNEGHDHFTALELARKAAIEQRDKADEREQSRQRYLTRLNSRPTATVPVPKPYDIALSKSNRPDAPPSLTNAIRRSRAS